MAAPQAVALGDMTNVAARLEAVAEPGTVLVGDGTARARARFVLEERGLLAVKGRARPVRAWRLLHARPTDQSGTMTPTVGRDAELLRLRTALAELHEAAARSSSSVGRMGSVSRGSSPS